MEALLKRLFEYQSFEKEESLEKIIRETEERVKGYELEDEMLDMVAAAGDLTEEEKKPFSDADFK